MSTGDQREQVVRAAYDAFNARELEAAAELLSEDVVWPNGLHGGTVEGRYEVLAYWQDLFETIVDSRVKPGSMSGAGDPRTLDVQVEQTVVSGTGSQRKSLLHRFHFAEGLISRLEVLELG